MERDVPNGLSSVSGIPASSSSPSVVMARGRASLATSGSLLSCPLPGSAFTVFSSLYPACTPRWVSADAGGCSTRRGERNAGGCVSWS